MGIDYSFSIGIGYVVSYDSLVEALEPWAVKTEDDFHMEDRFDPKTGKKIGQEKVVDFEGETTYKLGKKKFEYEDEFLEALFDSFGAEYSNDGGMSEATVAYITVKTEHTGEDDFDGGRVFAGSSILFSEAMATKTKAALKKLAKQLTKMGLEPGEAKIFIENSVS